MKRDRKDSLKKHKKPKLAPAERLHLDVGAVPRELWEHIFDHFKLKEVCPSGLLVV